MRSRTGPELSVTLTTWASHAPDDGWTSLRRSAIAADRAGVDRLVMSDHVVMGENLDRYADPTRGGQEGGRQPTGPDGIWLDPLAVIAHLTAVTDRVRFGTNILLAALRRPVVLAGQLATIDTLSHGRLDIGVGVGWQEEEYVAAGLSFAERGRLLDHTLEVCETLWRAEGAAAYSSDELTFHGIHQQPQPVQVGGVPIWVSGTVNPRSMRRLARFGRGWIPWGPDAADLPTGIERMRAAVADHDRDPDEIGVVAAIRAVGRGGRVDASATMAPVPALVDAGATDIRVGMRIPDDPEVAEEALGELVEAFRAVAG